MTSRPLKRAAICPRIRASASPAGGVAKIAHRKSRVTAARCETPIKKSSTVQQRNDNVHGVEDAIRYRQII